MKARTTLLAVLALALALAGTACQAPAQEAGPLSDEDVAAIEAVAQSYQEAQLANDYAAVASHYTEDAVLMSPNQPLIEGRAAIQAALEGLRGTVTEYSNTPVQIEGRGDFAYARGIFTVASAVEGMPEPVRDTAKYLAVLRKQPDGSWLLTLVCWNSDLPLPEEGAETET
ncbi:MAG: SgcJ/EcaC family oxidoreductase [Gemmatimonadota bacterium]|nr:MAG: SgcJ/EcaC family oxidoreductase [Gemmatimonadota bacterium]